ncbi:MAG: DNA topoisomerase I [Anaerolineae bacterium]
MVHWGPEALPWPYRAVSRSTTIKWKTMRHQGVAFPPEYEPRGMTVQIQFKPVNLEPLQEEMLMAWAKKLTTPYVQDPVFRNNFLDSLRQVSAENHFAFDFKGIELSDIDLEEMQVIAESEKLANMPEEERKRVSAERKKERDELKEKYGQAEVDGNLVDIAAYLVEPPGIFMGRGAHPMRGKWKPRVYPEDVELNLDKGADRPQPMLEGHEWKGIVHEHDGLWVARWTDKLADKTKYVWLAETSHLRQEREKEKYEKAKRLANNLDKVREHIREGMQAEDERTRRAATVACLIDTLAMRVGDEKDEDEADTVGASTLRVEHVRFAEDHITFDFLGKDSVRWEKELAINRDTRLLAKNLKEFSQGKRPDEQIFHDISSAQVNDFLRKAMKGLSAKVFRTYHATTTVEDYLKEHRRLKNASTAEKDYVARMANLQAAIKCNHKRTPPKNWEENLAKREQAVEKLRADKPDLSSLEAQIKSRKKALAELQAQSRKFEAESPALVAKKQEALDKLEAGSPPESDEGKAQLEKRKKSALKAVLDATKLNKAKTKRFKERIKKAEESLARAQEAREKAETNYEERVKKAELQFKLAQETRDYNLNTSLKNYIDPRKYRLWGEKVGYDWGRLYTGALQRKFKWAHEEEAEYEAGNGDDSQKSAVETLPPQHAGNGHAPAEQPKLDKENAGI